MFDVCRSACHDSSFYLFVLLLFLQTVVLSQVYVAFNMFYQHIVHVNWSVVYNHHRCLYDVIFKPTYQSSDSSCSICCNSCGAPEHKNMSSANWRLLKNSPSILIHTLVLPVEPSKYADVNSVGCVDVLVLSCPCKGLSGFFVYTSSISCSCNDVNIAWVCTESNAFSQRRVV